MVRTQIKLNPREMFHRITSNNMAAPISLQRRCKRSNVGFGGWYLESVLQSKVLQVGLFEEVAQRREEVDELLDARQVEEVGEGAGRRGAGLAVGVGALLGRVQQDPVQRVQQLAGRRAHVVQIVRLLPNDDRWLSFLFRFILSSLSLSLSLYLSSPGIKYDTASPSNTTSFVNSHKV